jgi:basic membrane protein A
MKRRLYILTSILLVVALFAIAGTFNGTTVLAQSTAEATLPPLTKQFKVALVAPSTKNDLAWTQSIADALTRVQTEAGGKDKLLFTISENLFNVPDAQAAIRDYASQGYDLVIAHGTQYGAVMFEVAKDFPDVSFAWGTATDVGTSAGLKNVFAYEARAEEGGYVNGVMASLLTKSGTIGIVGPIPAGDAKLYIDGFVQGATASGKIKPDSVKVIYTGSFGDTAKAGESAKTLISQGADVLTGSAQQVPGAITEIQKVKGYWFGTQSDQAAGWADTTVASQVYDWAPMLRDIITLKLAGTVGGKVYTISLKDGGEKIVFNDKVKIPDDVKAAAASAAADIESGKIVVVGNPSLATPAATAAK